MRVYYRINIINNYTKRIKGTNFYKICFIKKVFVY